MYFNYIKNNPEGYWFKRKLFGWGWTPARWQGWLTTLIFVAFILWQVIYLEIQYGPEPTGKPMMIFIFKIVVTVLVFIVIAYKKGEKPKWQWGIPDKYGK